MILYRKQRHRPRLRGRTGSGGTGRLKYIFKRPFDDYVMTYCTLRRDFHIHSLLVRCIDYSEASIVNNCHSCSDGNEQIGCRQRIIHMQIQTPVHT